MQKLLLLTLIFFLAGCTIRKQDENVEKTDSNGATVEKYSAETENLIHNLKRISKQYILFGHQDATAYGVFWKDEEDRSDLKSLTGSYPAVYGWDLGHLELGKDKNLDGVSFVFMKNEIIKAYERGGVNTLSWHLNNPVNGLSSWDTSSYSVKTILSNDVVNATYKYYLDRVAQFLMELKTDKGVMVPVIFRPFHEHTGSWFWWGENFCTPEEYIDLWRFTIDYLRIKKRINHIVVAYSSGDVQSRENYLERYPGDDYVDMLGFDDYAMGKNGYADRIEKSLTIICDIAEERNKIPAFTETGSEQIPNPVWYTEVLLPVIKKYPIAYALLWRNANNRPNHYYVPYPGHPAEEDFLDFFRSPRILFGDRVADLKLYQ